jgi:FkbM family methyltransferase
MLKLLGTLLRLTPIFPGKNRIARFFLYFFKNKSDLIIHTKSGNYFVPNIIEAIGFDLFVNGCYENGLIDLIIKETPMNGIFIDVGANIGTISIPLALKRPDIKIVSFEASQKLFQILKNNIQLNNIENILIENYGVFDKDGEILNFQNDLTFFGKGKVSTDSVVGLNQITSVESITLDSYFPDKIHGVLKIDVEGAELNVLKGFQRHLKTNDLIIIYEDWEDTFSNDMQTSIETSQFLNNLGFDLSYLDNDFNPVNHKTSNKIARKK